MRARARSRRAEEIALLRRLSRIADASITDAFAAVAAGDTEMDIAAAMTRGIYAQGADQFRLMIVATGERSVFPNVGPTERKLVPQDVCRVEIFAMLNGYHAGVCRTAVVQSPPPHAERIWANLVACKYLILDMIKPGASSRAIYEAFLRKLSELDLPPISFVGHGIGLHLHEDPYLGKYSDTPLEAGMVLGIEPLVYRTPYGFGMQNKDMVLVTDDRLGAAFRLRRHRQAAGGALTMARNRSMAVKTVAILGAGHGGYAAAADLSRRGYHGAAAGAQSGAARAIARARRHRGARHRAGARADRARHHRCRRGRRRAPT